MLSLERLGQAHLIEDYWRVFLLFGAVIQIIDDWTDLESDLEVGHYSYVSLGLKNINDPSLAKQNAKILRSDADRVAYTHARSKEMIGEAHAILNRLNDQILMRLVDVTNLRLDTYFRKELKFNQNS
jgi:hypothetical protein